MIHIILAILKVVGILILILLGILLFLVLALLFVPFGYRLQGKKYPDVLGGKVILTWLFGLVFVQINYQNSQMKLTIRLFGIEIKYLKKLVQLLIRLLQLVKKLAHPVVAVFRRLTPGRQGPKKEPQNLQETKVDCSQDTVKEHTPLEKQDVKEQEVVSKKESASFGEEQEDAGIWGVLKVIIVKILSIPRRILQFFKKIYVTIRKIYGRIKQWKLFLTMESTKKAWKFLVGEGKVLLRHIKPRKIKGNLTFGFDNPATTGQFLAGLSIVYPFCKDRLIITPVFNEEILEGDLYIRGHILGWVLLKIAWKIYRNKDVKTTIRKFQHKEA